MTLSGRMILVVFYHDIVSYDAGGQVISLSKGWQR